MKKFENNLTEGSVVKKLILFALPFLGSNLVQSMYNVADMLIVGNFCGPESMSGVNIGGQITLILTNIIIGLCVGATVLISQYIGANNRDGLEKVTATIITLLVGLALVISVVMLAAKDPLLRLIQTPEESYEEAGRYLTVTVTGIVFIFGYNALSAILRGMGDSKRPFMFVLAACVTNIVLDLLLVAVFGLAAFGAALATVISQAMSVVLCVRYMIKNKFHFDFKPSSFRIDMSQLKMILKIGLPTCIQNGITNISFLFITAIVNIVGGVSASAAVGAANKFNSFVFMPIIAVSSSVSTMCAQNIGAGKLDRAVKACRLGIIIAVCISYSFFVFVRIHPETIIALFNNDPQVIADGVTYLRSFSFDFLLIPFIFCLNGMFIGGGHTMFTMFNSMLSSVILRAPVCYIFGVVLEKGLAGVGMGAPAASAGSLAVITIFLLSGKWKHNRVKKA